MNVSISPHAKDIIQKHTAALLREIMPEFYGIKIGRVKELINPELPEVTVAGGGTDMIFLTDDEKYLHLGFETGKEKTDIHKHLSYDARLIARDGREVITVIIYTADVSTAPEGIKGETLVYNPHIVLMAEYDGDSIYDELNSKISAGQQLDDKDILNLLFLPLMKNSVPREELALKSVEMAKTIPDHAKRDACLAAAIAFTSKYLTKNQEKNILEVLKVGDYIFDLIADEGKKDVAREMLRAGETVFRVVQYTKLDKETVLQLQKEVGEPDNVLV